MNEELKRKLEAARDRVAAMSPEEYGAMISAQRQSYVRAESSWPAPNFRIINGVKTYDSYEDYCND